MIRVEGVVGRLVESDRDCVCLEGVVFIENGEMVRPAEYGHAALRRRVGCRAPAERPAPARSMVVAVEASMVQRCRGVI